MALNDMAEAVAGEERFKALMTQIFNTYYVPHLDRLVGEAVTRHLEKLCSPTSPDAPGAPSSPSSPLDPIQGCVETTCLSCGASMAVPVPKPTMLRASLPSVGDEVARQVLWDIDAALSDLERLGGDAPHRAIPVVARMKALFWMVAREVASRTYKGAWNQATDGATMPERHYTAFTRSVIDGQVPREWEPKS